MRSVIVGRQRGRATPDGNRSTDHTERIRKLRAQRKRELAEEAGALTQPVSVPLKPGERVT